MAYIGEDKFLLFGGISTGLLRSDETWVYDLSDNVWTQMAPSTKPSPRDEHAMAYIGGDKVLLYGGQDDSGSLADAWVYDLSNDQWTQKSSIPTASAARDKHAMAYIGDDKVLLVAGISGTTTQLDTRVYDLSEDTWTWKLNDMDLQRRDHSMAYIGGDQVVLFGGYSSASTLKGDTWVYDLSVNSWTEKSPSGTAPTARGNSAMAYIGGDQVLLFGGDVGAGASSDTYTYDLSSNRWTKIYPDTKPSGRHFHSMARIGDGRVVLFGGLAPDTLNGETWAYPLEIAVSPTSGLSTKEDGTSASFSISVGLPPTADVTIPLSSSDTTEGTAPVSVVLPAGSTSAVPVTVSGVDDSIVDGNIGYTIVTGDPTSGDAAYGGLTAGDVADVSVVNQDDDVAGIIAGPPTGLTTTEGGGTATIFVSLDASPTADVIVPLTSSDPSEGTVPASVTLPAGSSSASPVAVTVTGVDDAVLDGDVPYTIITGDPTSADAAYNALGGGDVNDVTVTNRDNEVIPGAVGDLNKDGFVDILDVRLCYQIAEGFIAGETWQRTAADINGDGDVTREDAVILAEYVIGIRLTLP